MIPDNIAVFPARNDTGKRVVVNSIGGPSWPDRRTGPAVIANWNSSAKHKNDKWKRALENVGGVVVWGPYKLWYEACDKTIGKSGQYIKNKGDFVLTKQRFVTEPYWNVLLDGYGLEIMFAEEELLFV